ncbi:MAG: FecR domain-containing protein [Candidatus Polarisedimenticolia bacterium]
MATRKAEQPTVILDWFNVSYRALFTSIIILIAAGGVGSYYAYLKLFYEGSPKAEARQAINQAEESLEKAGPVAQHDSTTELKQTAQRLLAEARRQYDAANFMDARKAAVESKLNAEKAVAIGRGESAREVQFYRVEGDVKVKRVRELIWVDAEQGMSLTTGDQIKTSSRASAQIIYFNGTITTVKPGSLLEIKDLYDNPATRVQHVRERLREGRITASTQEPAAAGSFHEVSTHNTVATSDARTNFEVAYDKDDERTNVEVFTGKATLAAGSAPPVALTTAQRVNVNREAQVSPVQELPPAPVLLTPVDQKIFLTRENRSPTVELMWEPLAGAVGYHLQIASQPLFSQPIAEMNPLRSTAATLPEASEGGYYWRVAALFQDGTKGPFSASRKFKVVSGRVAQAGDTTPPDVTVDNFLVFASQVIVRGRTEPGALLTVEGQRVDVYDDGSFTTVVALKHEGINRVLFVAQDMAGNEKKVERTATVNP